MEAICSFCISGLRVYGVIGNDELMGQNIEIIKFNLYKHISYVPHSAQLK